MKKVVGYIRVSTERQGEEGVSLDEQAHMLRGFCHHRKYDLISIQEDDRSAAGSNDHSFRPGLQEAIRIAEREGASLLVPSADRLARNTNALSQILEYGLRVISVADGRRLGRKSLELLIDRAQRERDVIAERVRKGAKRAKANGVKLGNQKNLPVAQRNGAISNVARADRKVRELADFIEQQSGWSEMKLREKVECVNAIGPHNLISERRNERRPWTISSIRKPLKRAEEEVLFRNAMALEPVRIAHDGCDDVSAEEHQAEAAPRRTSADENSPGDEYKDHPNFGLF